MNRRSDGVDLFLEGNQLLILSPNGSFPEDWINRTNEYTFQELWTFTGTDWSPDFSHRIPSHCAVYANYRHRVNSCCIHIYRRPHGERYYVVWRNEKLTANLTNSSPPEAHRAGIGRLTSSAPASSSSSSPSKRRKQQSAEAIDLSSMLAEAVVSVFENLLFQLAFERH